LRDKSVSEDVNDPLLIELDVVSITGLILRFYSQSFVRELVEGKDEEGEKLKNLVIFESILLQILFEVEEVVSDNDIMEERSEEVLEFLHGLSPQCLQVTPALAIALLLQLPVVCEEEEGEVDEESTILVRAEEMKEEAEEALKREEDALEESRGRFVDGLGEFLSSHHAELPLDVDTSGWESMKDARGDLGEYKTQLEERVVELERVVMELREERKEEEEDGEIENEMNRTREELEELRSGYEERENELRELRKKWEEMEGISSMNHMVRKIVQLFISYWYFFIEISA